MSVGREKNKIDPEEYISKSKIETSEWKRNKTWCEGEREKALGTKSETFMHYKNNFEIKILWPIIIIYICLHKNKKKNKNTVSAQKICICGYNYKNVNVENNNKKTDVFLKFSTLFAMNIFFVIHDY